MISSPIEEIKNRLDIVDVIGSYIKLHKAGANYRAVCPFHSEKKPSFFVNPTRQIWHCFGSCSEGGDMFKFVMKIEGVEFGDALRLLAKKAGVELKKEDPKVKTERQRVFEITELACLFFEKQLDSSSAGKIAKDYLLKRGIKEESIKKWRLGYSPDIWDGLLKFLTSKGFGGEEVEKAGLCLKSQKNQNYYDRFRGRIIFPIFDLSSQPIGFGGRAFKQDKRYDGQDEAKYINSPATILYDKSRILYGLNNAGVAIRKNDKCILVEGYTDVIMTSQSGIENVAATSGTALTPYQLKILKRYSENLYTAFDMDLAGGSATKRGIDLAQTEGFNIKVITMPEGKDPADVALENSESFKILIDQAKSIHDFYLNDALSKFDKNTIEGKRNISKIILPVIKKIPNKIEQGVWIKSLAEVLQAREEDILEELSKISSAQGESNYSASNNPEKQDLISKTRKELLEERLISLLFKLPQGVDLISQNDLKLFSLDAVKILDYFKNKDQIINSDLSSKIDYLSFKAELEEYGDDPKVEFASCFKELKFLAVKNKLSEICRDIKIAEQEKNSEKVQELVKEFCFYSKSRNDLESQTS